MLHRPETLKRIDSVFTDQPLVLTLGGTIREMLAEVGRKANHLYCLDAMGQPLAIGLGLALGLNTDQKVLVIEGDGSSPDGVFGFTTVGHLKPKNLVRWCSTTRCTWRPAEQPTFANDMTWPGWRWLAAGRGRAMWRVRLRRSTRRCDGQKQNRDHCSCASRSAPSSPRRTSFWRTRSCSAASSATGCTAAR